MTDDPIFQRLRLLTGASAVDRLQRSRAAVFGLGGVGSWAAEALVRSGVGAVTLVDGDVICISNLNRQLQATALNVGRPKAAELAARLAGVSPGCRLTPVQEFFTPATAERFDLGSFDYVLDCIDSIGNKVDLIMRARANGATLYSSMGAATKLDPTRIKVASIWKTQGCPLARRVRRKLREAGFAGDFQTVFSPEVLPGAGNGPPDRDETGKTVNGSAVHVTAVFGMMLAGLVVQDAMARAADPAGN